MFLKRELVDASKPLYEIMVQEAHSILMSWMFMEDGVEVNAGSYKINHCATGEQLFTSLEYIEQNMRQLISNYNAWFSTLGGDPFSLAAWLSYEFVMVHPFMDGNGQLSRKHKLLLRVSVLASGIPFPTTFGFSKYKKAKKHYIQCLRYATSHGGNASRLAFQCIYLHSILVFQHLS
jgi:Fic family protein